MKNPKILMLIGAIAVVIGVVLLFKGITSISTYNTFKNNNEKIQALVTDSNSTSKYTAVSFFVESKEYKTVVSEYSSDIKTGDEIEIFYNKENPSEVMLKGQSNNAVIYFVVSIAMLFAGLSVVIHNASNTGNKTDVKKSGKLINAELLEIVCDTKVKANGQHPYYIKCKWKNALNGKEYVFKSEPLWYNPNEQFKKSGLTQIPVYIIPSNPKQYYVDMESVNSLNV